ncbi:MAG: hypothetical protein HPY85_08470 [Anaerolineae bacterium]|nr:hypothetical protein [Anaerolineae bacterium]
MKTRHPALITLVFVLLTAGVLLAAGIVLGACNFPTAGAANNDEQAQARAEVDGLFWDLYVILGGVETFGRPISPVVWVESLQCQYMMNALFCYDPALSGADAYSLAPVVRDGSLMPPSVLELPPQQGEKLVNGFTIHPDFVALYDQMYGTLFTGQPMGEAWVNYEKERIEQYFENVIMAQDLNDPEAVPYLLPAAYAVCTQYCETPDAVELPIPVLREVISPFGNFFGRINGGSFGEPLTRAFYTPDGQLMQVFRGAVVTAPADNLDAARFYPLADELGMYRMEPVYQSFGTDRSVFFYPITEKGFHVPILFDDFISAHGGRHIAGDPIAETAYYDENVIRQCFENICLDLQEGPEGPRAVLAPLGAWYLQRELDAGRISTDVLLPGWVSADTAQIAVGEQQQVVDHKTPQIIIATVYNTDGTPLHGIGGTLRLDLPEDGQQVFDFPASDHNGIAYLYLPLVGEKGDLAILHYTLCLHLPSGEDVCTQGAYVVDAR